MKPPRLWRLIYGPDWHSSVEQADRGHDRFRENRQVLEEVISFDPFHPYTRVLWPENDTDRVATTRDVAAGYRMVVFYRVDRTAQACTLEWMELEDL